MIGTLRSVPWSICLAYILFENFQEFLCRMFTIWWDIDLCNDIDFDELLIFVMT